MTAVEGLVLQTLAHSICFKINRRKILFKFNVHKILTMRFASIIMFNIIQSLVNIPILRIVRRLSNFLTITEESRETIFDTV